jgi:hypothetical protein
VVIVDWSPVQTERDVLTATVIALPLEGAGLTVTGVVDEVTVQLAAAALLVTLML